MRTVLMLDDELIKSARKLTGIKAKQEVVHEASHPFILLNEQSEIRNLGGKLKWEGH